MALRVGERLLCFYFTAFPLGLMTVIQSKC
jgi:hypothetical protein